MDLGQPLKELPDELARTRSAFRHARGSAADPDDGGLSRGRREAKALAAVAKGNDEAKDKEQFKKVAETCKSCHEKYKKKD